MHDLYRSYPHNFHFGLSEATCFGLAAAFPKPWQPIVISLPWTAKYVPPSAPDKGSNYSRTNSTLPRNLRCRGECV